MRVLAMCVLLVTSIAGCGASSTSQAAPPLRVLWRAPADPMALARRAGLVPERYEHLAYHVHAHLDIFLNGQGVRVPAGIGINIHDPGVQHDNTSDGPAYGGIQMCRRPCISPLHTHDGSGLLHTETATVKPNRLGQFFIEWNVGLSRSCVGGFCRPKTAVAIYVDGKLYRGDPRTILLSDRREIAIVIGKPPRSIPSSYPPFNS